MVLKATNALKFLDELEDTLRRELLRTWKDQGHYMDGTIVESADFVVKTTLNKLEFLLYIFPYGGYIESGVPASKIPFSGTTPGSGGTGRSRYIQALISYAKKRMSLPDTKAKQVAFAIAHKQKKEGMPTARSSRFSSSGKRTEWIGITYQRNKQTIERAMFNYVDTIFSVQFENIILKYQREFKKGA